MKILVVGGGGREHAIIRALKKSPRCTEIWCAPGNGGISYDAHCKAIPATDVDAMVKFAKEEAFDYAGHGARGGRRRYSGLRPRQGRGPH